MLRRKTSVLGLSHTSHGGGYIRCLKNVRIIGFLSVFLLLTLTLLSVFPIVNHQEQAEATPVASVTSIDIALGKSSANVEITPINANGTFGTSPVAEEASFSVATDNLTGYELSLAARSGDTLGQLTNSDYGGVLDTITANTTEIAFSTSATYTNKWGIKPSVYNSIANTTDTYYPAPTDTTGFLMEQTSGPNTTPKTYTIGVGARVDYTKPAGTYTNTYVLQAVSRPVAYEVLYLDGSSGSDVEVVTRDAGPNAISKIKLSTTIPTRATYAFNKWCDVKPTYPTNGTSVCSGNTYNPGDDFIPTTGTGAQNKLYAMWNIVTFAQAYAANNKTKVTYSGTQYYTMQDMSTAICSAVTNDQTATLLDNRLARYNDNSTKHYYTVAKIKDMCWMTQNLTYGYNANNTTSTTSYSFSITGANVSNKSLTFYNMNSTEGSSSSGHCYGEFDYTTGTGNGYSYPCVWYGSNSYSGGYTVWYNYAAATAGTITGVSNSTVATSDICPTNWRLPNSTEGGSFHDDSTATTAFRLVLGGYYRNGVLVRSDNGSWWWLSDFAAAATATRYQIGYGNGNPAITGDRRYDGIYVRCIAK